MNIKSPLNYQQMAVPFHNANLSIVNYDGQPYVPMKPIVEGMGLDWKSQFVKLKQRFAQGMVEITIPTNSGFQTMLCLLLRKLPAWLYSIHANKVKPELRDTVIMYQNECDDVLWEYWTGKLNARQQAYEKLNQLHFQEKLSKAKGSFHGSGLQQRKAEKHELDKEIKEYELSLQGELLLH